MRFRAARPALLAPLLVLAGIAGAGPASAAPPSPGVAGAAPVTYAYGSNASGQLGTGGTVSADRPTAVLPPAGVTFTSVAAGGAHSLGIGSNGDVYAWGANTFGQLGDGTTVDSAKPVKVALPAGTGHFVAVSAGTDQSYALSSGGTLYAWGLNDDGQLGDGGTAASSTPVAVSAPGGARFSAVSAGGFHVLALAGDGTAYAWGDGALGQLGQGTTGDSDVPVPVGAPTGETFTAVAAGGSHSLALTSAGTVEAWGSGGSGQLGDGTFTPERAVPAPVCAAGAVAPCSVADRNVLTVVTAIAAGDAMSEALVNGHVYDWGDNDLGQLGVGTQASCADGSSLCSAVPVAPFLPPAQTFVAISAGYAQGYALSANGAAWAWGDDYYGQLGDGSTLVDQFAPVTVAEPAGPPVSQLPSGPTASSGFMVTGEPVSQSITFPQLVKESTSVDFIPAVASSGLTPSVQAGPAAVCTANAEPAGTVTFNGQVGTCTVTARVAAGTVGGTAFAASGPATAAITVLGPEPYVPIPPVRVLDTRPVTGPIGVPAAAPVGDDQTISLHVAGASVGGAVPVPADATSVVLNVTVTGPTTGSYLEVWPAGAPQPTSSNLNFVARQTVPNLVQVGVGSGGDVDIYNWGGTTDVVADVEGYTAPQAGGPAASTYVPLRSPGRILDTRPGTGPIGVPVAAPLGATPIKLQIGGATVAGSGQVPADATAAVLNVTVTGPTSSSWLTAWPDGTHHQPTASNLNYTPGQTVPNRVIVALGADGKVDLANAYGTTEVVADISGYFVPGSSGAEFVPAVAPIRLVDTRPGNPDPTHNCYAGSTVAAPGQLSVTGSGTPAAPASCAGAPTGVPSSAVALVANVTVTDTTADSWVTVWPVGDPLPTASDLNYVPGETVPNLAVVTLGVGGKFWVAPAAGSTDVIVDVAGWYVPSG